jgi:hypothetical protein
VVEAHAERPVPEEAGESMTTLACPTVLRGSPTMEELAADPAWRTLMRQQYSLPANLRHGHPWVLWACLTIPDSPAGTYPWRWAWKSFATYGEAFNHWASARKITLGVVDWSIVCRPKVWSEPVDKPVLWPSRATWCGRCRRPVVLHLIGRHRAVHTGLAMDAPLRMRCPFCGMGAQ